MTLSAETGKVVLSSVGFGDVDAFAVLLALTTPGKLELIVFNKLRVVTSDWAVVATFKGTFNSTFLIT